MTHTAADNLYLDGKRLVPVSGARGHDGAAYVVEGDPCTNPASSVTAYDRDI